MFSRKKGEKLFAVNYVEDTTFNGPTKKHKKIGESKLNEMRERADIKIISAKEV